MPERLWQDTAALTRDGVQQSVHQNQASMVQSWADLKHKEVHRFGLTGVSLIYIYLNALYLQHKYIPKQHC